MDCFSHINEFKAHDNKISYLTIGKKTSRVLATSSNELIKLWAVGQSNFILDLKNDTDCTTLQFIQGDEFIVSGDTSGCLKVWDPQRKKCILKLDHCSQSVTSMDISSNGIFFVNGTANGTIYLYDARTAKCVTELKHYDKGLNCVAFDPSDLTIASASEDSTIKIWDLSTKKCIKHISSSEHKCSISSLQYVCNGQGQNILASSDQTSLILWDCQNYVPYAKTDLAIDKFIFDPCGEYIYVAHNQAFSTWSCKNPSKPTQLSSFSADWDHIFDMAINQYQMIAASSKGFMVNTYAIDLKKCWDPLLKQNRMPYSNNKFHQLLENDNSFINNNTRGNGLVQNSVLPSTTAHRNRISMSSLVGKNRRSVLNNQHQNAFNNGNNGEYASLTRRNNVNKTLNNTSQAIVCTPEPPPSSSIILDKVVTFGTKKESLLQVPLRKDKNNDEAKHQALKYRRSMSHLQMIAASTGLATSMINTKKYSNQLSHSPSLNRKDQITNTGSLVKSTLNLDASSFSPITSLKSQKTHDTSKSTIDISDRCKRLAQIINKTSNRDRLNTTLNVTTSNLSSEQKNGTGEVNNINHSTSSKFPRKLLRKTMYASKPSDRTKHFSFKEVKNGPSNVFPSKLGATSSILKTKSTLSTSPVLDSLVVSKNHQTNSNVTPSFLTSEVLQLAQEEDPLVAETIFKPRHQKIARTPPKCVSPPPPPLNTENLTSSENVISNSTSIYSPNTTQTNSPDLLTATPNVCFNSSNRSSSLNTNINNNTVVFTSGNKIGSAKPMVMIKPSHTGNNTNSVQLDAQCETQFHPLCNVSLFRGINDSPFNTDSNVGSSFAPNAFFAQRRQHIIAASSSTLPMIASEEEFTTTLNMDGRTSQPKVALITMRADDMNANNTNLNPHITSSPSSDTYFNDEQVLCDEHFIDLKRFVEFNSPLFNATTNMPPNNYLRNPNFPGSATSSLSSSLSKNNIPNSSSGNSLSQEGSIDNYSSNLPFSANNDRFNVLPLSRRADSQTNQQAAQKERNKSTLLHAKKISLNNNNKSKRQSSYYPDTKYGANQTFNSKIATDESYQYNRVNSKLPYAQDELSISMSTHLDQKLVINQRNDQSAPLYHQKNVQIAPITKHNFPNNNNNNTSFTHMNQYSGSISPSKSIKPTDFINSSYNLEGSSTKMNAIAKQDDTLKSHLLILNDLNTRLGHIRIAKNLCKGNKELKAIINNITNFNDEATYVDILNIISQYPHLWTLDLSLVMLPRLEELLNHRYETYMGASCKALKIILKNFGPLIKASINHAGDGIGVDLSREERSKKCRNCYKHFIAIKNHFCDNAVMYGGKLGRELRDLQILLQTFEN